MKKIIIIVVVLLIVLGGGGAAAWFFLLAPDSDATVEEEPEVEVKEEVYFPLDKMTMNLAERDVNHFLQVDITLMYYVEKKYINDVSEDKYDPALELVNKLPKIQDRIITLVRNTEYIEFTKADAKDWLADEIRVIVNEVMQDEDLIQDVYITNYFLD